jgi:DNA-directed RNA polymerase specialized sigma24 family protein
MLIHEPIAARATALLEAVREGDVSAAEEYVGLLWPILRNIAMRRGRALAARAPGGAYVPDVPDASLEDVASRAAYAALERATGNAFRFDRERGDGASWALGALPAAYLDAARDVTGSRRAYAGSEVLVGDLAEEEDRAGLPASVTAGPEEIVVARDRLERALAELSEDERYVVLAKLHLGMSYAEIALYRFRDPALTKKVDRLLQSAKRKLEEADERWRAE